MTAILNAIKYESHQKSKHQLSHLGEARFGGAPKSTAVYAFPYNETLITLEGEDQTTTFAMPLPSKLPCGKSIWYIHIPPSKNSHDLIFAGEPGVFVNGKDTDKPLVGEITKISSTLGILVQLMVTSPTSYLAFHVNLSKGDSKATGNPQLLTSGALVEDIGLLIRGKNANDLPGRRQSFEAIGLLSENGGLGSPELIFGYKIAEVDVPTTLAAVAPVAGSYPRQFVLKVEVHQNDILWDIRFPTKGLNAAEHHMGTLAVPVGLDLEADWFGCMASDLVNDSIVDLEVFRVTDEFTNNVA
jgi:hypothetical protein